MVVRAPFLGVPQRVPKASPMGAFTSEIEATAYQYCVPGMPVVSAYIGPGTARTSPPASMIKACEWAVGRFAAQNEVAHRTGHRLPAQRDLTCS